MPIELRVASNGPTRGAKGRRAWISIDLHRAVRQSRASVSPRIITLPIQSQRTTSACARGVTMHPATWSSLGALLPRWSRGRRSPRTPRSGARRLLVRLGVNEYA